MTKEIGAPMALTIVLCYGAGAMIKTGNLWPMLFVLFCAAASLYWLIRRIEK